MSLASETQARYSTQRLVEITNPNAPAAVAVDAARLAAAAADAEGDFLRLVGVPLDLTVPAHVGPAVRRVYARLLYYMDPAGEFVKNALDSSDRELEDLRARIGTGTRFAPQTDSVLSPSYPDTTSGRPVRPDFDPDRYSDYVPGQTPRDRER